MDFYIEISCHLQGNKIIAVLLLKQPNRLSIQPILVGFHCFLFTQHHRCRVFYITYMEINAGAQNRLHITSRYGSLQLSALQAFILFYYSKETKMISCISKSAKLQWVLQQSRKLEKRFCVIDTYRLPTIATSLHFPFETRKSLFIEFTNNIRARRLQLTTPQIIKIFPTTR